MSFYITKRSGEQELFNIKKFRASLARAGAPPEIIDTISQDIEQHTELHSTQDIYSYALQKLKKLRKPSAARYSLKRALAELGPAGFPFERYIAELYNQMGYEVANDQIAKGFCVEHEIDVIARKDDRVLLIECKFHTVLSLKSDLKIALYVQARHADIEKQWQQTPYQGKEVRESWVVTNTKFTSVVLRYATCAGLKLLGWNYPEHKPLPDLINEIGLHPITALTTLKRRQKLELVKEGLVLCKDIKKYVGAMRHIGMTPMQIDLAIEEAEALNALPTE